MPGDHVFHQNLAAGGGGSHHVGAGLDLVGDDGIASAVELIHTVYLDGVGAGAADIRTHGVEEVGQVHNMGLSGGVFNDGAALGQGGCQHDVHGGAYGNLVQIDPRAVETAVPGVGIDKAVFHVHIGAQGGHALDVLVDGAHAEVAAAGHGGLGAAETAQHGADQIIGGPDLPHQIIRGVLIPHIGAVNFNG